MPVLFYIFGGAFNAGHASYDFYGPELFMDHGVIVVTPNYRTGPLGEHRNLIVEFSKMMIHYISNKIRMYTYRCL